MWPLRRSITLPMFRTERFLSRMQLAFHFLAVCRRIKRFPAHTTANQIKRNHLVPLPDQKVLKLNGFLRTDSPALSASGAFSHIMFKRPATVAISKTQCRCRAVFHAGQTPVTVLVNYKICHFFYRSLTCLKISQRAKRIASKLVSLLLIKTLSPTRYAPCPIFRGNPPEANPSGQGARGAI